MSSAGVTCEGNLFMAGAKRLVCVANTAKMSIPHNFVISALLATGLERLVCIDRAEVSSPGGACQESLAGVEHSFSVRVIKVMCPRQTRVMKSARINV